MVDARGTVVEQLVVDATAAGLRELVLRLHRAAVAEVAIGRNDGLVVDTLLGAGLTVVVIAPNQVNDLRGRYGSARNKDDRFDAFVLADTLRTDRVRLRPLSSDTPATVLLRSTVRARTDLITHRVELANQLREHLPSFHPRPVGLFADLDSIQLSTGTSAPHAIEPITPSSTRAGRARSSRSRCNARSPPSANSHSRVGVWK